MTAEALVEQAQTILEPRRNLISAEKMARYMKGRYAFLGLPRTVYQPLMRPWLVEVRPQASEKLLLEMAGRLWKLPEREYQYLAGDLLDRYSKCLTPASAYLQYNNCVLKCWGDAQTRTGPDLQSRDPG